MTRRISIPDDHVALVLPSQLADEIQSLLMTERQRYLTIYRKNRDAKLEETVKQERVFAPFTKTALPVLPSSRTFVALNWQ